jgi:hypothetical protein
MDRIEFLKLAFDLCEMSEGKALIQQGSADTKQAFNFVMFSGGPFFRGSWHDATTRAVCLVLRGHDHTPYIRLIQRKGRTKIQRPKDQLTPAIPRK